MENILSYEKAVGCQFGWDVEERVPLINYGCPGGRTVVRLSGHLFVGYACSLR